MFGLRGWQRRRTLARAALDDALWQQALARCRVIAHLDAAARHRLRELTTLFLAEKTLTAVDGFELTDAMRVAIAIQACVPVLELGLDSYAPWVEVIVYPDEFVVEREFTDDDGVVHAVREPLSGESWANGPVILSWADIEAGDPQDGYNVVLHEFAHKLDMLDGDADGVPPLHAGMRREDWHAAFTAAFDDLEMRIERVERRVGTLRGDARDFDGRIADEAFAALPLDPYACKDAGEFFACASESFFETPSRLADAYPEVYRQLVLFYRQDPLAGHGPATRRSDASRDDAV
ncbi:MAG: zinc-dependent peptidase [Proteobacteria bacterium]|nr:zinc-dependent peptidase [Burkholderiales bacterium]